VESYQCFASAGDGRKDLTILNLFLSRDNRPSQKAGRVEARHCAGAHKPTVVSHVILE
jgi:hypothetical protein